MDQFAIDPVLLVDTIKHVPGVSVVLRVRSRWIGSACAVDMIIAVDPKLSTTESHAIADEIERQLEARFQVSDISIHIEPEEMKQYR